MEHKMQYHAKRMNIDLAWQHYDRSYKSFEGHHYLTTGWSRQESLATWQSEKVERVLTSGEATLIALQNARAHVEDYMQVLNSNSKDTKDDVQKWLNVLDDEEAQINAKLVGLRELKAKPAHDKRGSL